MLHLLLLTALLAPQLGPPADRPPTDRPPPSAAEHAPVSARADPPLCHVVASSAASFLPGIYTVQVRTVPGCPTGGHALIRLESYVGGSLQFQEVTPDNPLIRAGIPWYWRGSWQGRSGVLYPFVIPGMVAPFTP